MLDLKEKASSLASSALKKDNRLKSLEISLEQKREECVKLDNQLKKVSCNITSNEMLMMTRLGKQPPNEHPVLAESENTKNVIITMC